MGEKFPLEPEVKGNHKIQRRKIVPHIEGGQIGQESEEIPTGKMDKCQNLPKIDHRRIPLEEQGILEKS